MATAMTSPPCAASSPTGRSIRNARVCSARPLDSRPLIDDLPVDHGHLHVRLVHLSDRDLKGIAIDHHHVCEHPRFDRAALAARTHLLRGIDGKDAYGLFERNPLHLAERFAATT